MWVPLLCSIVYRMSRDSLTRVGSVVEWKKKNDLGSNTMHVRALSLYVVNEHGSMHVRALLLYEVNERGSMHVSSVV